MSRLDIQAASYLGPAGYGTAATGLRPWPTPHAAAFAKGDLSNLHWSLLFPSDPGRFERMDLMSRLGLMAAELLGPALEAFSLEERARIGVLVETCAGSLATDLRFLQTPRASLFTYTLPSTVIGEICIRHRLRGPVLCLMTSAGVGQSAVTEALAWLEQGDARACLCIGCEAVDSETAAGLGKSLELPRWHSCAVLVGNAGQPAESGLPRAHLSEFSGQPLAGMCLDLCRRV